MTRHQSHHTLTTCVSHNQHLFLVYLLSVVCSLRNATLSHHFPIFKVSTHTVRQNSKTFSCNTSQQYKTVNPQSINMSHYISSGCRQLLTCFYLTSGWPLQPFSSQKAYKNGVQDKAMCDTNWSQVSLKYIWRSCNWPKPQGLILTTIWPVPIRVENGLPGLQHHWRHYMSWRRSVPVFHWQGCQTACQPIRC